MVKTKVKTNGKKTELKKGFEELSKDLDEYEKKAKKIEFTSYARKGMKEAKTDFENSDWMKIDSTLISIHNGEWSFGKEVGEGYSAYIGKQRAKEGNLDSAAEAFDAGGILNTRYAIRALKKGAEYAAKKGNVQEIIKTKELIENYEKKK